MAHCREFNFPDEIAALGVVSNKPKMGSGNHSIHSYVVRMRGDGYVAYGAMTPKVRRSVFAKMLENGGAAMTECNVLNIAEMGSRDHRTEYVFFKTAGDATMLTMFLNEVMNEMDPEFVERFYHGRMPFVRDL